MARSQLKSLFDESNREEPVEVGVGDASMEAAYIDIKESFDDVVALESDLEELETIAEGLSSVVESMEATMEQGGLDPIAAQFVHHAVDAYTGQLGIESERVLPGLEAFGGYSGREASTTVSIESVSEQLKKIWNAIRAAVEKAIAAVKNFFSKVFGGLDKFENRLIKIEKDLKSQSDWSVKKNATFKAPSPNQLQYNGKVDVASVKQGVDSLEQTTKEIYTSCISAVTDYYSNVNVLFSSAERLSSEEAAKKELADAADKGNKTISAYTKLQGRRLAGDKLFKIEKTQHDKESSVVAIPTMKYTLENAGSGNFSGSTEVPVPSNSDLQAIVGSLKSFVDTIKGKKSVLDKLDNLRDKNLKAGKSLVDKADGKGMIGKIMETRTGKQLLDAAKKEYTRPITTVTGYGFGVARAAIGYVESAMRLYQEPKES